MMKWITTFCTICIFLLKGYSEPLSIADSLRQKGQFELARLTYERVVYQSIDNATRTLALLGKANCYMNEQNFQGAQITTERIVFFGLSDSLIFEARFKSGLAAFLNGDFKAAESQLLSIDQLLPAQLSVKASLLYSLTLNELGKWNAAKSQVLSWADWKFKDKSLRRDSIKSIVELAYSKKRQPKYRDPKRADLWSTIIPGSGQLYSGYFFDGAFTALMVATGVGVAALGVFVVKYYVTGLVLGYGIYQRFYSAGIKRSEYLARKKNYTQRRAYNDCLQELIIGIRNEQA